MMDEVMLRLRAYADISCRSDVAADINALLDEVTRLKTRNEELVALVVEARLAAKMNVLTGEKIGATSDPR